MTTQDTVGKLLEPRKGKNPTKKRVSLSSVFQQGTERGRRQVERDILYRRVRLGNSFYSSEAAFHLEEWEIQNWRGLRKSEKRLVSPKRFESLKCR